MADDRNGLNTASLLDTRDDLLEVGRAARQDRSQTGLPKGKQGVGLQYELGDRLLGRARLRGRCRRSIRRSTAREGESSRYIGVVIIRLEAPDFLHHSSRFSAAYLLCHIHARGGSFEEPMTFNLMNLGTIRGRDRISIKRRPGGTRTSGKQSKAQR